MYFMKTIEWKADRHIKDDYDVVSYEVQPIDFLHIAVKSIMLNRFEYVPDCMIDIKINFFLSPTEIL